MRENQELLSEDRSAVDYHQWANISRHVNSLENHQENSRENTGAGLISDTQTNIFADAKKHIQDITNHHAGVISVITSGAAVLCLGYLTHKPFLLSKIFSRTLTKGGAVEIERSIDQLAARRLESGLFSAAELGRPSVSSIDRLTNSSVFGKQLERRLTTGELDALHEQFARERQALTENAIARGVSTKTGAIEAQDLKGKAWEEYVFAPPDPKTYVHEVARPPLTGGFKFEDWELGQI